MATPPPTITTRAPLDVDAALAALARRDWECVGAPTRAFTHGLHRYASKYIPQIARYLIDELAPPGGLVVDPFVGSGTTLVEAALAGRPALGFDRNPLALLIAGAKVALPPDATALRDLLLALRSEIAALRQTPPAPGPERFVNEARWFQPVVRAELEAISRAVASLEEPAGRWLAAVALSAIIRSVSNADPSYGNLLIAPARPPVRDTFERFARQLTAALDGSLALAQARRQAGTAVDVRAMPADARRLPLADGVADAVITHPPYLAAVPYAEYQRLSLNWLRTRLAGAVPCFDLAEAEPRQLDRVLLGGQRRSPDLRERFADGMLAVLSEVRRVLRPGGAAAVVIGNPRDRGEVVPLDRELADLATQAGLRLRGQFRRGKYNTTMGKLREEFIQVYTPA